MVVTAQPIVELGTCYQGASFPVVITFKNGSSPADPPSPSAVMSLQDETNPPIVVIPTLVKTSEGVYGFNAKSERDGDWILSVRGGWEGAETPSLGHLKVIRDPNYNNF